MLSSLQNSPSAIVPEFVPVEKTEKTKNFRTTETDHEQDNLCFYSQHLNTPGLLLDEYPAYYDSNFEVANRAFYATINKFTRQNCPDASKRRSPYSFLENWHLHSIYSKSQQTLLGITPVRPSVLLSGDDFMFTPPFIQQEQEEQEEDYMEDDEEYWEEFYNLSPCPDSNQDGNLVDFDQEDQDTITLAAAFPTSTATNPSSSTVFETSPNTDTFFFQEQQQEQDYFYSFGSDDRPIFPRQNIWMGNEGKSHNFDSPMNFRPTETLLTIRSDDDEQDNLILDPLSEEPELSVCSSSSDEQQPTNSSRRSSISSISVHGMDSNFTTGEGANNSCHAYNDDYDINISTTLNEQDQDETKRQQQEVALNSPVTRSESFFSQRSSLEDSSSIMSYQSLADLINNSNCSSRKSSTNSVSLPPKSHSYGSVDNQTDVSAATNTATNTSNPSIINSIVNTLYNKKSNDNDEEMGIRQIPLHGDTSSATNNTSTTLWGILFIYIVHFWKALVSLVALTVSPFCRCSSAEREPLL